MRYQDLRLWISLALEGIGENSLDIQYLAELDLNKRVIIIKNIIAWLQGIKYQESMKKYNTGFNTSGIDLVFLPTDNVDGVIKWLKHQLKNCRRVAI